MLTKKSLMSLMGYVPALVVQYFAQHEQYKIFDC
ncbi:unnamed protein product (macronuclear) [Paramecium tetraurelia]|uniref:Uncharacterized protein n=1 Tax=Paramecium tetraurelia TaxID=5888 RepID=A0BYP9_PARTE|nr:uncharacterized protein GSPATT00033519001 [Paramecium tetraurelia]CAK63666.1 unnamed protein product [Paramecium tetraurelia]|eukprot:XP_001431064.1 hypothetical protein (macronuclear) [Paramecium tetraurelia strain d4-2]